MTTARGIKRSAIHDRLAAEGAYFKDVSGWEGADWYAGVGQTPDPGPLSFQKTEWWKHWEREHTAVREGVILMDMSFMSKFDVQGSDAGRLLNWLSTNNVDGDTERVTYTQWLNVGGGIEADLTVTKLGPEKFFVLASDTCLRHVETWMQRHFEGSQAFVADVTSAWTQLNIQGPKSRALLQRLTAQDLSDDAFPFRTARPIDIGFAEVLCQRITYLGELGYELFIPTEMAAQVYERLVTAGKPLGLVHAGLKALASCRMEKGYRDWGHDIDNTDDVLSTGLGFVSDLQKPEGFLGKDAVLAKKGEGPLKKRMIQVLLEDPDALLFHAEPVLKDGKALGYIRSASYGFTLGGAVGLAMIEADEPITPDWLTTGTWEVQVANILVPAKVSLRPFYDP